MRRGWQIDIVGLEREFLQARELREGQREIRHVHAGRRAALESVEVWKFGCSAPRPMYAVQSEGIEVWRSLGNWILQGVCVPRGGYPQVLEEREVGAPKSQDELRVLSVVNIHGLRLFEKQTELVPECRLYVEVG